MADTSKWKGIASDFIKSIRTQFIGKGADPNDIFVQDLYNYESNKPQGSSLMRLFKKNNTLQLDTDDRKVLESLYSIFNEHISTKKELLTQSRTLYETSDIVSILIDVILDDGFNNFYNEKEEFKIEYCLTEEEKNLLGEEFQNNVQRIIDEFVAKFQLKQRIAECTPDLIRDGEYAFGIKYDEKEKGIKEIIDDIDVIDLLPFYEGNKVSFIIKQDTFLTNGKYSGNANPPKFYNGDNFVFFKLNMQKKKINLSLFYDNGFRKEFYDKHKIWLPKYTRIPQPMYSSAIKYLNRLKVMENVSTVLDLADVLRPEIVSVTVPSQTNEVEARQIIRDYERHLNDKGDLSNADSLDIETLASSAYRKVVLPQWLDNKGQIASSGIGANDSNKTTAAWESIGKIRNLIALIIGIPPYYLNISEQPQEKAQTIKLYSRYTNKLTSIQKSLAEGTKDIIMRHLTSLGVNIDRENLNVTFKTLTNGDNLDDLDLMVGTIEGVNNYYKGLQEIVTDDSNNFELDEEQFLTFYNKVTSRYLNSKDMIRIKEEPKQSDSNIESEEGFESGSFEPGNSGFEPEQEFEVTGEGPTASEESFTSGSGEQSAYDNYASHNDNITLEGPQQIITEI